MGESEAFSPELPEGNPIDIDKIFDEDEEVLRRTFNQGRTQVVESDAEESKGTQGCDGAESEKEDSAKAEAEAEAQNFYHVLDDGDEALEKRPLSPHPSPNHYAHPLISKYELDFDWDEDQENPEAVKAKARKKAGKHACVGLSSTASDDEIKWCLKYYNMGGLWARPHHNSTRWSEGRTSNTTSCMEPFFYTWPDYERIRTQLNIAPSKISLSWRVFLPFYLFLFISCCLLFV